MSKIDFLYSLIKIMLHWIGLFGWSYCFLLLMEIVVCKDARLLSHRILELSFRRRYRIFLRNLKNPYYLASVIILISSLFALCQMSLDIWSNNITKNSIKWALFHPLITCGIAILYRSFGYRITYIAKIKEFI